MLIAETILSILHHSRADGGGEYGVREFRVESAGIGVAARGMPQSLQADWVIVLVVSCFWECVR